MTYEGWQPSNYVKCYNVASGSKALKLKKKKKKGRIRKIKHKAKKDATQ